MFSWIDFEQWTFNAFVDAYLWWFYPGPGLRTVRMVANYVLATHILAVVITGYIFMAPLFMGQTSSQNLQNQNQIIVNTQRLNSLEDANKVQDKQMYDSMQDRINIRLEFNHLIDSLQIEIKLIQQELTLYRWGFGIIFTVLVGQLGVAIFSTLMRREMDRRSGGKRYNPLEQ